MKQENKTPASLFIIMAGILWGCIGLFVRPLNALGLSSMEIVFLRVTVTFIVMFFLLLVIDRQLLKIKLKDLWCFIGTGIASIVFFNFCYFKAITLESMAVAAVLLYTAPAIVMILSAFLFKEKFTVTKVVSLIVTFIGCVFVAGVIHQSGTVSVVGILTGLGAGFGYALYSIFGKYALMKGYQEMTITFYTFLLASIGSAFFADFKNVATVMSGSVKNIFLCLGFGIVCTILPYLLYTSGLKHVENGKASILASIEPVTATIVGLIVFKEFLTIDVLVGVILVIAGISISSIKKVTNSTS